MARKSNGSKLFLTELMISIFFFIVVVAVCIQLFSESHKMSEESTELTNAVNVCSNVAEFFIAWNDDDSIWNETLGRGEFVPGESVYGRWESWTQTLDENMNQTSGEARYELVVSFSYGEKVDKAYIKLISTDDSKEIYSLEVERLYEKR